jgi:hypothetical protein
MLTLFKDFLKPMSANGQIYVRHIIFVTLVVATWADMAV